MLGQGEGDVRSAMVIPWEIFMSLGDTEGMLYAAAVSTLVAQRNVEAQGGKWAEGKFGLEDLGVVELSYLILA